MFAGHRIFNFFFLLVFKMSSYCLLASVVFEEKLATNHSADPLHLINCVSFVAFKIFTFSFINIITICLGQGLFEFILLEFVEFLDLQILSSITVKTFSAIILSNKGEEKNISLSEISITCILAHLMASYRLIRLCSFFFTIFVFPAL